MYVCVPKNPLFSTLVYLDYLANLKTKLYKQICLHPVYYSEDKNG